MGNNIAIDCGHAIKEAIKKPPAGKAETCAVNREGLVPGIEKRPLVYALFQEKVSLFECLLIVALERGVVFGKLHGKGVDGIAAASRGCLDELKVIGNEQHAGKGSANCRRRLLLSVDFIEMVVFGYDKAMLEVALVFL